MAYIRRSELVTSPLYPNILTRTSGTRSRETLSDGSCTPTFCNDCTAFSRTTVSSTAARASSGFSNLKEYTGPPMRGTRLPSSSASANRTYIMSCNAFGHMLRSSKMRWTPPPTQLIVNITSHTQCEFKLQVAKMQFIVNITSHSVLVHT